MKIAICPGSFDPVTLGHKDIIERAAALFDRVIVLVMTNSEKHPLFTVEERVDLLGRCIQSENVEIDTYNGLLVNYAKSRNAVALADATAFLLVYLFYNTICFLFLCDDDASCASSYNHCCSQNYTPPRNS